MTRAIAGFAAMALAAVVTGCSFADMTLSEPPPDPEPPYRQLISENMQTIFVASSGATDHSVSRAHQVKTLPGRPWFVCLKARFVGTSGEDFGFRTYLIRIEQEKIVDRRLSVPDDGCEQEAFETLSIPATTSQAAHSSPSALSGAERR